MAETQERRQAIQKARKESFERRMENRLDGEIDHVLACMKQTDPAAEEYARLVKRAAELENLRYEVKTPRWKMPSSDTIFTGAITVACVVLVLWNDQNDGLFTSKAVGFIPRPSFH